MWNYYRRDGFFLENHDQTWEESHSHTILSHSQKHQYISMELAIFQKTLKIPHQSGNIFISMPCQMSVVSVQSPARGQVTGRLSQERLQKWLRKPRSTETERFLPHRCYQLLICCDCNKCSISFFLNSEIKSVFFTSSSLVSSFTKAG